MDTRASCFQSNWNRRYVSIGIFLIHLTLPSHVRSESIEIETVCVDDSAIGYATFQSHNQKVLQNKHGIFMTHIRSRNDAYDAQCWRLLRSQDRGRSFDIIHEATHATNPAAIETDNEGNLYLMRPDWKDNNTYLYRYLADEDFKGPHITVVPRGVHGKFCMEIDLPRRQIYYFAADNTFHVLNLDGVSLSNKTLTGSGPNALIQYPHLYLAPSGVLHAAWTSQKHNEYLYWDIHAMKSEDGGESWLTLKDRPLELPVVVDSATGADLISLPDEYEVHTWLSSFLEKQGKLHFFYMAQFAPARTRYVRYDLGTGEPDVDLRPSFRGEEIELKNLDGFFASDSSVPNSPLYCVSRWGNRIGCLVSTDNGMTWCEHAASVPFRNPYSIGGCPQVTDDGTIIGSFTDQATAPGESSRVYFFRIRAQDSF